MAVDREGVAVEDREVRVLARLEAAHAVRQVEHARALDRERGQRRLARHAGADAERRHAEEQAAVGDAVVGVEGDGRADRLERQAVLPGDVLRLELAARAVDQDQGRTYPRGGDLVRDLPGVADVVQDDAEAELLGDA